MSGRRARRIYYPKAGGVFSGDLLSGGGIAGLIFEDNIKNVFMTNRKIASGILTGIAAGIVLSLLLKTKAGRKTGKKILERGSDLSDDLKGKFGEFVDQLQGRFRAMIK